MAKRATLAPSAQQFRSPELLWEDLNKRLHDEFSLDMLGRFSVIFEGWTDVGYVDLAVSLYQKSTGSDLLDIPEAIVGAEGGRIDLFTPGLPNNPTRGGVPQMVRLAKMLKSYVFIMEAFDGLMFVFDHDDAGLKAAQEVKAEGYKDGVNIATLNPKEHPNACATKQVCIEDLLSLNIQRQFFESTTPTCSVDYVNGEIRRFHWHHDSKPALRDFVVEHAAIADVEEIVQLVKRIRRGFGLPE